MTEPRKRTKRGLTGAPPIRIMDPIAGDPTGETLAAQVQDPEKYLNESADDTTTEPKMAPKLEPKTDGSMEPSENGAKVGAKNGSIDPGGLSSSLSPKERRRARVRGSKLHPRKETEKLNAHVPTFLHYAVRDVADELYLRPGEVLAEVMEAGLRALYPTQIGIAYRDRCDALGVADDWKDEE